jgi:DNA sulfur modification protein DndD
MILNSLKVTNFRVFKGTHEFSLTPKSNDGHQSPIILFGGLNGAGKTTTLTAIRTALYGRQSLGIGTSQKEYLKFLAESVHNSKVTGEQTNRASVELVFSYAKLGLINVYRVSRSWIVHNHIVTETLKIFQDDSLIQNLNQEQAQGFLNELIPIGVSDLFFFDGEKIAQLAEDNEGSALAESVKKLIGLDLVEKLIADITVFINNQNKQKLTDDIKSKILGFEEYLEVQESLIELKQQDYEALKVQIVHAAKRIDQLTNNLNTHGGAWAASREQEIKKLSSYSTEKEMLQAQIRDIISDGFPLSIAPEFVKHCLVQLDNESQLKKNRNIASVLAERITSLNIRIATLIDHQLFSTIKKEIDLEFAELITPSGNVNLIHDVSDTTHQKISATILDATTHQRDKIRQLTKKLNSVNQEIDDAGINIARAPEQELLNIRLNELNESQIEHTELVGKASQHKEAIRTYLREAIKTARALDKLHGNHVDSADDNRALDYAYKAKNALTKFAKSVAVDKIIQIESEFTQSFQNLARKDDININAKIDPHTFSVKLLNTFGHEILKENLSAGERQIYAIAMLDALAKTSGRKLPIIIDTPLGRLDSIHRKKLVENYFPNASHQVIILSTDTEIGEAYLSTLQEHISHSIMLNYSGKEGSSNIGDGYFWNTMEGV